MKSKKLKSLLALLFALSLVFGAGTIFVTSKDAEPTYAEVKREGGVDPGDESEESSEVTPQEDSSETTPEEETPKESSEESSESSASESTVATEDLNAKNVFKALGKAFRDAWLDLLAHIKKWFKK